MNFLNGFSGSGTKKSFLSDKPIILGGNSGSIPSTSGLSGTEGASAIAKKLPPSTSFDWNQQTQQDWPSFFFQNYLETIFSSPVLVAETLLHVQYQKRRQSTSQDGEEGPKSYQPIEDPIPPLPLYLPRLKGDFVVTSRLLSVTKHEGWSSCYKGHLCHFLYRSLFSFAQPYIEVGFCV